MATTLTLAKLSCILFVTLGFSAAAKYDVIPGETLMSVLLANYNPIVRPAHNHSEAVHVRHSIMLINFKVKEEGDHGRNKVSLEAFVFLSMKWDDFRLKWNPKLYHGINSIKIPASKIWTPDITLYESFLPMELQKQTFRVVVDFTGSVLWIPAIQLTESCSTDDLEIHNCYWRFGSWVYNGYELDLYPERARIDLDTYETNENWDLLNTSCSRVIVQYACCPEPYITLKYGISFKKIDDGKKTKQNKTKRYRSGLFGRIIGDDEDGMYDDGVSSVLLLPTVIVSLLVPFQFLVPPESCQRISVLTILLVALVGLFFVTHATEVNATESPLDIDYFYYVSIVWVFVALLLSIFTLHICRWGHSRSKLPVCLRKIFLVCLSKVVCVSYNTGYDVSSASVRVDPTENDETEKGTRLEEQMNALLNVVRGLSNYLMELRENHNEWYLLALVLDRLLCVIFLIIFIIFACIVLV